MNRLLESLSTTKVIIAREATIQEAGMPLKASTDKCAWMDEFYP
jgi:hypothetical protein